MSNEVVNEKIRDIALDLASSINGSETTVDIDLAADIMGNAITHGHSLRDSMEFLFSIAEHFDAEEVAFGSNGKMRFTRPIPVSRAISWNGRDYN